MLDQIMAAGEFDYLGRGMKAASLRQEVIANNLANVNTPKFKRSEVAFEALLAKELYGDRRENTLPLVRTHDKHLPMGRSKFRAQAKIEMDNSTTMRVDQNNVDVDIEMASLAKNQIYYNAMATELSGYINRVKSVIQPEG